MNSYSLSHLADGVLLRELGSLVTQDRVTTAALLAHLGEVDDRKLYLPAAHPSMYSYCVHELRMSEDTACRRISVARTARQFPSIFAALADGRLSITSVLLLAPQLTPGNANELLEAAAGKSKESIRLLLAQHFPQPDLPTLVQVIAASAPLSAPERVVPSFEPISTTPLVPLPASVESRPRLAPLSPGRFALQATVNQHTYEQLRYAQALLAHAVPSGDVAEVLGRALDALIEKLEKKKFAKCARSSPQRGSANPRHIPAHVRRAVSQRDGGQCTFVSDEGQRCEARARLEFDHAHPVARGGQATIDGIRLRCRAHNQYEAERTFGEGFMHEKREQAQRKSAEPKATAQAAAKLAAEKEITPWLRSLGFTAQEARRGADLCAHMPDASIEARVRVAVQGLAPACVRTKPHMPSAPA